jgi:molybdopterin converting factor small subunit
MRVEVRLYATLRQYLPGIKVGKSHSLALPDGATVADMLAELRVPIDDTKQAFVNGHSVELDHVLNDGDSIGVFPPIGGGADAQPV